MKLSSRTVRELRPLDRATCGQKLFPVMLTSVAVVRRCVLVRWTLGWCLVSRDGRLTVIRCGARGIGLLADNLVSNVRGGVFTSRSRVPTSRDRCRLSVGRCDLTVVIRVVVLVMLRLAVMLLVRCNRESPKSRCVMLRPLLAIVWASRMLCSRTQLRVALVNIDNSML